MGDAIGVVDHGEELDGGMAAGPGGREIADVDAVETPSAGRVAPAWGEVLADGEVEPRAGGTGKGGGPLFDCAVIEIRAILGG